MPAGRRYPRGSSPPVTARSAVFKSCCAHRNILIKSCLVHGDSSGAGGSSCNGHGGHSQPPAPLSLRWKRLMRDPVRAPDSSSCPKEASASELSPGGLPVPVGCPVPVLSCLFSPGGLLKPPNFPREFFLGGRKGSGCGGRAEGTEAKAPKTTCHGLLSSLHRHGLCCLFRSGGPHPVFVLRGLQSAHPSSPVELLRHGTRLPGGGSYVRVLLCVSCVPASCAHIWFVSCPRLMSL